MRRLGVVGIVLVGLLALTQAISLVTYVSGLLINMEAVTEGRGFPVTLTLLLSVLPALASFAFGVGLIASRQRLARWWFEDLPVNIPLDATSLLRLGLVLIGVTYITQAVPTMIGVLASSVSIETVAGPGLWLMIPRLGGPLVQVGLGALLIAFSRALARRLWSGRAVDDPGAVPGFKCPSCGAPFDPDDYRGGNNPALCSECKEPLDVDRT